MSAATSSVRRANATACRRAAAQQVGPGRSSGAYQSILFIGPMKLKDEARFSTICIHAGQEPDPATGAIITPIYQTSTYVQDGLGQPHAGFEYGRTQNPTRMALERNVAAIEAGTAAFAFASGMAAIDALLTRLEA